MEAMVAVVVGDSELNSRSPERTTSSLCACQCDAPRRSSPALKADDCGESSPMPSKGGAQALTSQSKAQASPAARAGTVNTYR